MQVHDLLTSSVQTQRAGQLIRAVGLDLQRLQRGPTQPCGGHRSFRGSSNVRGAQALAQCERPVGGQWPHRTCTTTVLSSGATATTLITDIVELLNRRQHLDTERRYTAWELTTPPGRPGASRFTDMKRL